jgi:anaerobic selenocysteine-containing dehydrogenase
MEGMPHEQVTFCRICEPFCGMIATVEDDRLVSLRPDKDHPLSQGYACQKGIAYAEVQNDPDRVTHPLKRQSDGTFTQVSWDVAMADIIDRLGRIKNEYGGGAIAAYLGNPGALNYSNGLWLQSFMKAIGSPHVFTAGSQDTNSRFAASHLLYGVPTAIPIPDVAQAELFVVLGANPLISHGSLLSMPRMKYHMNDVTKRGGRVLVIDPRRTETASKFEWLPIIPDTDAWLLLSLLQVLFADGLADEAAIRRAATGVDFLKDLAHEFTPESTAAHTGVPAEEVRSLAHELASRKSALYGRTGTCLGSSSTLVNFLMDAVNLASGNLDVRGGAVFGESPAPLLETLVHRLGLLSYGAERSRIGNFPDMLGSEPAANMAAEITTPGTGQIRALVVSAGNPVLSTPNGPALEEALGELDLMVSLDLYVNETNAHAHYVLPGTAMYEREDAPIYSMTFFSQPFFQVTEAVVPPAGEARPEWEFFDELARGLGTRAVPIKLARLLVRGGELVRLPLTPRRLLDALIRTGRRGDRFGLRPGGLSFTTMLRKHPHGVVFAEEQPVGRLAKVVRHRDRKVHLEHEAIAAEVARLAIRAADPAYPLRLIGMRERRSENSWMHNAPALAGGRPPHAARLHPKDAAPLGVADGDLIRLVSKSGAIELPVLLTEDLRPGVVAVPHGWGHKGTGGWRVANQNPGANVNELASSDPADLEPLVGMSHLSGIPVRAEALPQPS